MLHAEQKLRFFFFCHDGSSAFSFSILRFSCQRHPHGNSSLGGHLADAFEEFEFHRPIISFLFMWPVLSGRWTEWRPACIVGSFYVRTSVVSSLSFSVELLHRRGISLLMARWGVIDFNLSDELVSFIFSFWLQFDCWTPLALEAMVNIWWFSHRSSALSVVITLPLFDIHFDQVTCQYRRSLSWPV